MGLVGWNWMGCASYSYIEFSPRRYLLGPREWAARVTKAWAEPSLKRSPMCVSLYIPIYIYT